MNQYRTEKLSFSVDISLYGRDSSMTQVKNFIFVLLGGEERSTTLDVTLRSDTSLHVIWLDTGLRAT